MMKDGEPRKFLEGFLLLMALCLPLKLPNSSSNKFQCNRSGSLRILSSLRLDIYRVIKISFLFQRGFKFRYIDLIDYNNL